MKLNTIAAGAVMAGTITSAAFGIGAGLAQAEPGGHGPGPNVPGPNVPGVPDRDGPGQAPYVPGQPICNGGPGANCNGPGSPLPPGQDRFPPPGHYDDPGRYGLPTTWVPPVGDPDGTRLPLVFNPQYNAWGVNTSTGFQVYTPAGGASGSGQVRGGINPGT
ncbi:hypothetical protein [Mycobacterium paraseoulense]|uniref:Uncharacterized protein n=1 Tax=Mycobacterium paraseoulense TaxID=590652 RepID=A0A1X0I855_9MYCO|nr:hypothetical protein [Mycobacterium paraseoulense]MCV7397057.1 hypothetical protein [Mycobacterium paraseoulense]ORB38755.1 hypothetical protein BST39_16650 [Mycobacterium paraseoulense]BBZ69652.1 hypothetical protein MPRS_07450 [Mycobacterium paraseoulense]